MSADPGAAAVLADPGAAACRAAAVLWRWAAAAAAGQAVAVPVEVAAAALAGRRCSMNRVRAAAAEVLRGQWVVW